MDIPKRIEKACYYIIGKKFNSESNSYYYAANFYTQDGEYIEERKVDYNERSYKRIRWLEALLDTSVMHLAHPVLMKVGTHIHGGYCVAAVDKNNNIIESVRYKSKITKEEFINDQLGDNKNPMLIDYVWIVRNDVNFEYETKQRKTRPRNRRVQNNRTCAIM